MTRYERQLEYMKGDKVWVLGVDNYCGQTIERQGREISETEKTCMEVEERELFLTLVLI